MCKTKYGYQFQNIGHSKLISAEHLNGIYVHICVIYEFSCLTRCAETLSGDNDNGNNNNDGCQTNHDYKGSLAGYAKGAKNLKKKAISIT